MQKLRNLLFSTLLGLTACQQPYANQNTLDFSKKISCIGTKADADYYYTFDNRFSSITDKFETTEIIYRDYGSTYCNSSSCADEIVNKNDSLELIISTQYASPAEKWYNASLDGFTLEPKVSWTNAYEPPLDHNEVYLTAFSPTYQLTKQTLEDENRFPEMFSKRLSEYSIWLMQENLNTDCDLSYDTGENI